MSHAFLKNQNYQIGIRDVIYLGENPSSSSFSIVSLKNITKETLREYQSVSEEKILLYWDIFLSFQPSALEKQVFLALNPSLKNICTY
jgi:hypothetical protein